MLFLRSVVSTQSLTCGSVETIGGQSGNFPEYLRSRGIEPGQDLWEIATKVLGAHRIEYGRGDPTSSEAEREALPESYVMKNGQLMGSPLSFPILCAINFVAYKTALRRYIKAKGDGSSSKQGQRCRCLLEGTS